MQHTMTGNHIRKLPALMCRPDGPCLFFDFLKVSAMNRVDKVRIEVCKGKASMGKVRASHGLAIV